ncbi:MAG TPA: O-antigen ligase family protein [Candidatus Methylomirabilis sp.]|nr:O-antigen ligase family protein [Candidatus Methylomirabilis sp.]
MVAHSAADVEPGPGERDDSPEPGPRSTPWAVRALLLYIALLPVHSLLIAVLLTHAGVPVPMLRALAAWKEVLLLAIVLALAGGIIVRREPPPLVWVDAIALAWFIQVLLYLGLRDLFVSRSLGLAASLYGARDWLLYVVPYVIGRLIVVSDRDLTMVFRTLLAMGALTSAAGILEYLFVPTRWHLEIGIPRYFGEFLNLQYPGTLGLPTNYWQYVRGHLVRRAVSVHLSPQAFALSFLLLWPLCLLNLRARWTRIRTLLVALNGVALLLTLTRMTIAVCFLQGLMVLWMIGRRYLLLVCLAVAVTAAALFMGGSILLRTESPTAPAPKSGPLITFNELSVRNMVRKTLLLQDGSSKVRARQWIEGWRTLREHPAGLGLGSTGNTSGRLGGGGMGNDAGYLKVAGALGAPGLLIFLGWFFGIVVASAAVSRVTDGPWQGLGFLTLATAVGWLVNDLTAPPDQSLFLSYVFPWLAGMTVSRWAQLRAAGTVARYSETERRPPTPSPASPPPASTYRGFARALKQLSIA